MKPNQINDYSKSSYSNSEMQQLSFYVDTELFIIKQYEEEINFKMLPDEDADDGYYYKFNEKYYSEPIQNTDGIFEKRCQWNDYETE